MKIALVGNPNSGKTTLFNRLTGSNQYVGNWPGVTVEKKEGRLKKDRDVIVTDLPGIYSLSPYTPEEVVSREYLIDGAPDVVLNIIDGTNLERNLYLTDQLIELGLPLVVAVNMGDILRKNGDRIDIRKLSHELGCKVVEISALKGDGIDALISAVTGKGLRPSGSSSRFDGSVEDALAEIERIALQGVPTSLRRWYVVKLFERDAKVLGRLALPAAASKAVEERVSACEAHLDDDAESIITAGRYEHIVGFIGRCSSKAGKGGLSTSDKIDKVVTNRWLGLPIFAVVMFLVYFLSVTTVGGWATDWTNDGLFGDGWFMGDDGGYEQVADDYATASEEFDAFIAQAEEEGLDPESPTFVADAEKAGVVATYDAYDDESGENETVEVDAPGSVAAAAIVDAGEPDPHDYGTYVTGLPVLASEGLEAVGCAPWLEDLIVNGIIAGVGAVLGFVPQMLVLFLLLALLESCGYMARIAFVLDRVFRRFGLSGKSFVPILIGTGCGVPGIMASRTIENENDRRMTVMTTTFIPCSAKLPIIALIAGALFQGAWWVAPSAYFLGIAAILCSGIILKKTKLFEGDSAPFVMELPAYHLPTAGVVLRSMGERALSFIKKAGTIILLATIVVWFISGYGFEDGAFGAVADQGDSILAVLAGAIAFIFAPLGWGQWEAVGATITGLIAKENVVGTFGILYAGSAGWYATLQAAFTPAAAYSLLAFNLLCAPCFAAMGAIRREMGSARWFWTAIGYQTGIAYATALVIYQLGGLLAGEVPFGPGSVVAIAVVLVFLYLLFRPARHPYAASAAQTAVSAGNAS